MKRIVPFSALASILFSLTSLYAQVHEQSKKPGDVLKFEVSFAGQDADKVRNVSFAFSLRGGGNPNQTGFNAGFPGDPKSVVFPAAYVMGMVACRLFQSSASNLMATASASNTDFAS